MVCQFLITFLFPLSLSEGKLGAAVSFSTPVDPITAATEGQDPAARRQLRPGQRGGDRGERTGKQLEVKAAAAAAAGGRRWMNSTPQDQSATRSHSRSSNVPLLAAPTRPYPP